MNETPSRAPLTDRAAPPISSIESNRHGTWVMLFRCPCCGRTAVADTFGNSGHVATSEVEK